MPRGRRQRLNDDYTAMHGRIRNVRDSCICLINGICLCPGVDTPSESTDDSEGVEETATKTDYPMELEPDN